jgi:hypothetical protein
MKSNRYDESSTLEIARSGRSEKSIRQGEIR